MEGRRSSGTRTFFDVLKSWIGRGHTYDDDVRDIAAGVPLTVVARLRRDEGRWANGNLVLRRGAPAEWRGRGGQCVTIERGTVAAPRPAPLPNGLFSDIYLTSGGERIELRVPTADIRLVTEMLSQ